MNPDSVSSPPALSAASGIDWGSPGWATCALALLGLALVLVGWSYSRARAGRSVRVLAGSLKTLGLAVLILALVEPLLRGTRPKAGANAFAVLVDTSQSLTVRKGTGATDPPRADWVRARVRDNLAWRTRLAQDFDVRPYLFDSHLRGVDSLDHLEFVGTSSTLGPSLAALGRRFRGLPLAGILLVTDGVRTDSGDLDADLAGLPPIYPVIPPSRGLARDIGVRSVSVSQANFEAAPVVLTAEVAARGYRARPIRVAVLDEADHEVAHQIGTPTTDDESRPLSFRFQFRPDRKGLRFYRVVAASGAKSGGSPAPQPGDESSDEQTLVNNSRLVVVDQGSEEFRVLYISGRPNWEFKFLRRAIAGDHDEQVKLVGLLRIAKRLPKFDFQAAGNRTTSPLFNGFDNPDTETVERADQPVLVRLGTVDEAELRDGFPKTAEALFAYHAIIVDDLEASFFTADQMALLRTFVAQRGGGFLMLGGPDSFAAGKYDRTPVGDLLPVYLDRAAGGDSPSDVSGDPIPAEHCLVLTREGWLQPWVRTRATEADEKDRLAAMPSFAAPNAVGGIKPGATVLAQVRDSAGTTVPALVAQPFGRGRSAALLIGDLWRWALHRPNPAESDLDRSWRQTVRWLVADVPQRVEVAVRPRPDAQASTVDLTVRVRDAQYRPLDDARVVVDVTLPDKSHFDVRAEPLADEPGAYLASVVTRQPDAYRFGVTATASDGTTIGTRAAGWAAQPAADEFARLEPDRDLLARIAQRTGGEVIDGDRLDAFAANLASRPAPVVEPWTAPLWHQPFFFGIAILCLASEWGLRRINGLA